MPVAGVKTVVLLLCYSAARVQKRRGEATKKAPSARAKKALQMHATGQTNRVAIMKFYHMRPDRQASDVQPALDRALGAILGDGFYPRW